MGVVKIRVATLLAGGIGGVAPDFDHFLNIVSQGQASWDFLHTIVIAQFLFGSIVALIGGLLFTLVLGKKH